MLHLLAQTTAPINVTVPPPVINNISSGSWMQPLAVVAGGIVAAALVHYFTKTRERDQKLREAYASFVAESLRYLRLEWANAENDLQILNANDGVEAYESAHGVGISRPTARDTELQTRSETILRDAMDAVHRLRSAEAILIMLLGRDKNAIEEVATTYQRVREARYRLLPNTKPLPSAGVNLLTLKPGEMARLATEQRMQRFDNMMRDIEWWLRWRGSEMTMAAPFRRWRKAWRLKEYAYDTNPSSRPATEPAEQSRPAQPAAVQSPSPAEQDKPK